MNDCGIVYILSNPSMPNMVKIGMTMRNDITYRMRELYGTGVPTPFVCEYACTVNKNRCSELESALHNAFAPYRVCQGREFFRINPTQAISILKLFDNKSADVTDEVSDDIAASLSASELCSPSIEEHTLPFNNIQPTLSQEELQITNTILKWLDKYEEQGFKTMVTKLSDGYVRFSYGTRWWNICRVKVRTRGGINVKINRQALAKEYSSISLESSDDIESIRTQIEQQCLDSKKRLFEFRENHPW